MTRFKMGHAKESYDFRISLCKDVTIHGTQNLQAIPKKPPHPPSKMYTEAFDHGAKLTALYHTRDSPADIPPFSFHLDPRFSRREIRIIHVIKKAKNSEN
jgi:hypothetical protein